MTVLHNAAPKLPSIWAFASRWGPSDALRDRPSPSRVQNPGVPLSTTVLRSDGVLDFHEEIGTRREPDCYDLIDSEHVQSRETIQDEGFLLNAIE